MDHLFNLFNSWNPLTWDWTDLGIILGFIGYCLLMINELFVPHPNDVKRKVVEDYVIEGISEDEYMTRYDSQQSNPSFTPQERHK